MAGKVLHATHASGPSQYNSDFYNGRLENQDRLAATRGKLILKCEVE